MHRAVLVGVSRMVHTCFYDASGKTHKNVNKMKKDLTANALCQHHSWFAQSKPFNKTLIKGHHIRVHLHTCTFVYVHEHRTFSTYLLPIYSVIPPLSLPSWSLSSLTYPPPPPLHLPLSLSHSLSRFSPLMSLSTPPTTSSTLHPPSCEYDLSNVQFEAGTHSTKTRAAGSESSCHVAPHPFGPAMREMVQPHSCKLTWIEGTLQTTLRWRTIYLHCFSKKKHSFVQPAQMVICIRLAKYHSFSLSFAKVKGKPSVLFIFLEFDKK